jgi:hypothetical protein
VNIGSNPRTATVNIGVSSNDSDGSVFEAGEYKVLVVSVASDITKYKNNSEVATFPIPVAPTGTDQGSNNTPATAGDTPSS